jgi:hypothetical protein
MWVIHPGHTIMDSIKKKSGKRWKMEGRMLMIE